jgi:hypothetical protein
VIACLAFWWLAGTGAVAGQEVLDTVTSQAATFVVEVVVSGVQTPIAMTLLRLRAIDPS